MDHESLDAAPRLRELPGDRVVTIRLVKFDEIYPRIQHFLHEHFHGMDAFYGLGYHPRPEMYRAIEQSGQLSCFLMTSIGGEVAGYASLVHGPHRFFDGIISTLDLLYLKPEYRHSGFAKQALIHIEEYAISRGFAAFVIPCPDGPSAKAAGAIGAEVFETCYIRRLSRKGSGNGL